MSIGSRFQSLAAEVIFTVLLVCPKTLDSLKNGASLYEDKSQVLVKLLTVKLVGFEICCGETILDAGLWLGWQRLWGMMLTCCFCCSTSAGSAAWCSAAVPSPSGGALLRQIPSLMFSFNEVDVWRFSRFLLLIVYFFLRTSENILLHHSRSSSLSSRIRIFTLLTEA